MTKTRKLTMAGILIAVAVICSAFNIPIGASKCFPIQHAVNVLAGVMLGPWYAFGMAFATSFIRLLLGTGTLLAFPGSMFGALLCGLLYKLKPNLISAFFGEFIGTGLIGAMVSYPVAEFILGKDAAIFGYIIPFGVSSFGGALISVAIIFALNKANVFELAVNKE